MGNTLDGIESILDTIQRQFNEGYEDTEKNMEKHEQCISEL